MDFDGHGVDFRRPEPLKSSKSVMVSSNLEDVRFLGKVRKVSPNVSKIVANGVRKGHFLLHLVARDRTWRVLKTGSNLEPEGDSRKVDTEW